MAQKIVYLDCHSGISGDMLLGALLDTGLSLETIKEALFALPVSGYELRLQPYRDHGITGSRLEVVRTEQEQPARGFREISGILQQSELSSTVKERALAVFRAIGEAEAKIHGTSLDDVHFHEVGAVDAIVDIVGAMVALEILHIDQIYCSPLPLARGHKHMAHGIMPLPAPATLEILSRVRAPWIPCSLEGEFVTPTGAAIIAVLARFETPAIAIERVGYGFGKRRMAWPNCVRVFLGTEYGKGHGRIEEADEPYQHSHQHSHDHHTHNHDHHHHHEARVSSSLR